MCASTVVTTSVARSTEGHTMDKSRATEKYRCAGVCPLGRSVPHAADGYQLWRLGICVG